MSDINEKVEPQPIHLGDYQFGFHDDVEPIYSTGKGLSEAVVRELSAAKNEPEWMLEFRLKSLETFNKMPMQTWGADLSDINFDDIIYYQKHLINQLAHGMMFLIKSKKRSNVLVFQKQNVPILQEHLPNTNLKWFITT